jgi:hypothetical protein
MNKLIRIDDRYYDLELLSKKSDYFLAMLNFKSENIIDLSYRGIAYEIVIKILLDQYIFNKDYIVNYDEIMELQNELMLDNYKFKTIEDMCNTILECIYQTANINTAIRRYWKHKLTKKQKKSETFCNQYWKNIYYLDLTLSLEKNENIYKLNNSIKYDSCRGHLDFEIIRNAYNYRDLLEISNYLKFTNIYTFSYIGNFLNMPNNFELYPLQRFFVPFYLIIRQLNKMVQKIFVMGIIQLYFYLIIRQLNKIVQKIFGMGI